MPTVIKEWLTESLSNIYGVVNLYKIIIYKILYFFIALLNINMIKIFRFKMKMAKVLNDKNPVSPCSGIDLSLCLSLNLVS